MSDFFHQLPILSTVGLVLILRNFGVRQLAAAFTGGFFLPPPVMLGEEEEKNV